MRIKHVAVVMTAAIAVFAASASGAARARKYKSTISSGSLSTANGYPNPGGTAVLAGTLQLTGFGDGALVDRVKVTGHPQPNVFEFAGTEVDYLAQGTWRSTFSGKATVQPDGSQQVGKSPAASTAAPGSTSDRRARTGSRARCPRDQRSSPATAPDRSPTDKEIVDVNDSPQHHGCHLRSHPRRPQHGQRSRRRESPDRVSRPAQGPMPIRSARTRVRTTTRRRR